MDADHKLWIQTANYGYKQQQTINYHLSIYSKLQTANEQQQTTTCKLHTTTYHLPLITYHKLPTTTNSKLSAPVVG